jgi:SNF family Na+-dependent transporter
VQELSWGGLLLTIFVGWAITPAKMRDQLVFANNGMFKIWHALLKYLRPVTLIIVIIAGLT